MNPDLPPLRFLEPQIKSQRRPKLLNITPKLFTSQERRDIAFRVANQLQSVSVALKQLLPEQRRAVFLKLTHDRPLRLDDIVGTGLKFLGEPGETESLVVPKKDLAKLDARVQEFATGPASEEPKSRNLIAGLQSVEIGDPKERLSDAFLDVFENYVQQSFIVYELEVSSQNRTGRGRHDAIGLTIQSIRQALGNGIRGAIYDIDYDGEGARIMLWSTGPMLKAFVEDPKWILLITYFDLRPRFRTFKETFDQFNVGNVMIERPPNSAETICIIDSGVAAGNPFLKPVLRVEESRSWVYGASPMEDAYGHGSGVASLAAYHTLQIGDGQENRAANWIVSARIMTDEGELDSPRMRDPAEERNAEAKLLSTILREIVEHFQPMGVRIYVLSFEIQGHIWSRAYRRQISRRSWVARTIDQLSRDHDIVFCCITGNIQSDVIQDLLTTHEYPQYLQNPLAKILDPGCAAMAISIGSITHSAHVTGGASDPIAREIGVVSPFSRSGPGLGNSIKPDFVEYGGNLVRDSASGRVQSNLGTNIVLASSSKTPALAHANGTSFAAPRIAYHVGRVLADARSLNIRPGNAVLRALLAVASTPATKPDLLHPDEHLSNTGFGTPDGNMALLCENHSVLLYWQGIARPYKNALFRIHIPRELADFRNSKKRITVAVATVPPVQRWGVADYLGTSLKFQLFRGDVPAAEIEAFLQREDEEENTPPTLSVNQITNARLGFKRRSVGTLQCDTFEWSEHRTEFSNEDYTLAVSIGKEAKWLKNPQTVEIPLAVVVRIEDTSGQFNELYAKVKARVQARAQS